MKAYIDTSFVVQNPLFLFAKWWMVKLYLQLSHWGSHLRIGYMSSIKNVIFGKYNFTGRHTTLENVTLGDFSYVSDYTVILECTIGKFCSIGPNVRIAPGKHPTHTIVSTHPAIYSNPPYCIKSFSTENHHHFNRKVTIGNDVWIGANAIIADGVTLHDGAIVAGNALVTKNVAPYSIVSGVPAQHIRYRFEPDEIESLLTMRWWDKDLQWLEQNAHLLWNINNLMNR